MGFTGKLYVTSAAGGHTAWIQDMTAVAPNSGTMVTIMPLSAR